MSRKYWLDLFTGKTWEEFLASGAKVSGFRVHRSGIAKKIQPGDYFICYLTGISRFVGVIEVMSKSYFDDKTRIWKDELFPVRFEVKLIQSLAPRTAVPVTTLKDKLSIFRGLKNAKNWSGFFRGSPNLFQEEKDGEIIVEALNEAARKPVEREYDERLYWRRAKVFESSVGPVTVPETVTEEVPEQMHIAALPVEKVSHEEMQWLLLKLGSDLGLSVWVAKNDRNKEYNGASFSSIPNLRSDLPRQFEDATNRTIEMIDVLWLQRDAIVAAFEVEHTTAIYSGLLRMSDLISMQPNLKINLYIVAPDERRDKVIAEVNRPTFARLNPPLPKVCKFIPYSQLREEIAQVGNRVSFMVPQFIDFIAESCEVDEV